MEDKQLAVCMRLRFHNAAYHQPILWVDYFNCATWIDGQTSPPPSSHSDTVYLHIQLLLYSSSETYTSPRLGKMICIEIHLYFSLVHHLLKVIAYILNW
ncbi:hypothetical protein PAPYR_12995 [Paratrimastix pyriformis]|uniref:Uncharacterized protein n=1 Tax=Paratrimastix pyriformis TaxID=342808 RepID=A0ABQ8U4J5_9EUKA|nr:hypothetical protein PAPYR_12995 [Paratrimastix pyriformis]